MDKTEIQALIKESLAPIQAENKALKEMLAASRAPALINKHLAEIRLPDAIKGKITEALAYSIPSNADGTVDDAKLKTLVEAKAKEWADLLPELGVNMNPASLGTRMSEAEVKADIKVFEKDAESLVEKMADEFVGPKLVKGSVSEEARQARRLAREAFINGRAA